MGLGVAGLAVGVVFFVFAKGYETRWAFGRWFRSLIAAYYSWMFFYDLNVWGERRSIWWLVLASLWLIVGYFLSVHGYKQDIKQINEKRERKKAALGPDPLWSPEPIVGYRMTVHSIPGEVFYGQPASCRVMQQYPGLVLHEHGERSPAWGCSCGYYAMKSPDAISSSGFAVIVLLWGRVIECENGYRAERMMPIGYRNLAPIQFVAVSFPPVAVGYSDPELFRRYENLPVVTTPEALDALIEKALESFDPENPIPYHGGHNGHRQTTTED